MSGEEYSYIYSGVCCILSIVMLIVWIFVIVWVYKDAEKRGKSGVLWAIIVFFLGIIGLIIWLVVRPKQTAGVGYGPPAQPYQAPYQAPPGGYAPSGQAPPSQAPLSYVPSVQVYREKEIIREIVKIPCKYCGTLVDQNAVRCPSCNAPLK